MTRAFAVFPLAACVVASAAGGSPPDHRAFVRGAIAEMVGGVLDRSPVALADTETVSIEGQHPQSWLLRDGAVEALRSRSVAVRLDGDAEPRIVLSLSSLSLEYSSARRESFLGERTLERRLECGFDVRFVDVGGLVGFDTTVADVRRDFLPSSLAVEYAEPSASLAPTFPEGSWERFWQPVLVTSALAVVIYLLYASR